MWRVAQVAYIFFTNNKQCYWYFFNFCATLPIAPGTCKKVVKTNLSRLVKQADLSQPNFAG